MNHTQVTYLAFGIVLLLAIVFDLGLLSKGSKIMTIKKALHQTLFWVVLALGFGRALRLRWHRGLLSV